jgi:hypothetical protein
MNWLRRFLCALYGHPLIVPQRQFYAHAEGGIAATDEWRSCRCGAKASGVTRKRIRAPYGNPAKGSR